MKVHTTNYHNTFIEIAEDCPVDFGEIPAPKGDSKSIAQLQLEMLLDNPYKYDSDDIIYTVFAQRKEIPSHEWEAERATFFSKGQPCLRASPITKRHGWGVHANADGKIAIYGADTQDYQRFLSDPTVTKVKAMRTKKAS